MWVACKIRRGRIQGLACTYHVVLHEFKTWGAARACHFTEALARGGGRGERKGSVNLFALGRGEVRRGGRGVGRSCWQRRALRWHIVVADLRFHGRSLHGEGKMLSVRSTCQGYKRRNMYLDSSKFNVLVTR